MLYILIKSDFIWPKSSLILFYLVHDEPEPQRNVKSKWFIMKVMFFNVVARSQIGLSQNEIFSRKNEIFSFTYTKPAKGNNKNHVVGIMVTKVDESITKEKIKNSIIHKLVTAILE